MSDERNEQADGHRAQMKALLGAVVEQAPEPPSVAAIATRMAARTGDSSPGSSPATRPLNVSDGASDHEVVDLPAYAEPGRDRGDRGGGSGARWARVALIAAALLGLVAAGAVLVSNGDGSEDGVFADQPDDALAMLPTELPEGLAPIWLSSGVSDEGDRFAVVHYASPEVGDDGLPVGARLKVESAVVDPEEVDLMADARESGSVEVWDGREVVVTDEGSTVQFVEPAGLQVLVQGDPARVRAVVPTLRVASGSDWEAFVDDVDLEVASLPVVAAFDLIPNDLGEGNLMMPEVTTSGASVRITVHGDPETVDPEGAPVGGEGGSGVVAGTCLTVDQVTACRPGSFLTFGVAGGLESTFDVLIEGDWWHFGWSTDELTGVAVTPDEDGPWGVRWAYEGTGHGTSMSWYASVLPAEARQIRVELASADGGTSGFDLLRPAY